METKTVLHLTHTDISKDSRILKELEAIGSMGKPLRIVGFGIGSKNGPANNCMPLNVEIDSFIIRSKQINALGGNFKRLLVYSEIFLKFLYRGLILRPSVVHCHDTLVLPIALGLKILTQSTLVYDAHELESNKNAQTKKESLVVLFVERIAWRFIDLFISVSPKIIEWYNEKFGFKNSALILNSPLFREFSKIANSTGRYFHDLYQIPESCFIFVYVGILCRGRGIEKIVDSFIDNRVSAHVVFIGWGEYEAFLYRTSQDCNKIHIHAPVAHDSVVKLLNNANAGLCLIENVSLSDYYSLPNKLFEYSFAGLPVLASDFPEINRVVEEFNIGMTCKLDKDSIVSAINLMVAEASRFEFKNLDLLSWQSQTVALESAYLSLI